MNRNTQSVSWLRSVANRKTRISIRHVGIYVQVQSSIDRTAVPFSPRQSTTKVALVKATQPCNSDVVYSKYPNKFHSFFMTLHLRTLHIYGANETKIVAYMHDVVFLICRQSTREARCSSRLYFTCELSLRLGLVVFDNYSEGVSHPVILHAYWCSHIFSNPFKTDTAVNTTNGHFFMTH